MFSPRPYQIAAVDAAREALRRYRSVIIVGSTGCGKTAIAGLIARGALARGSRALFLAPRIELVYQPREKFLAMGIPDASIGVLRAGDRRYLRPDAPLQIASYQTASRRELPPADLVFVDECHLAASPTTRRILDAYPRSKIVGLTATPVRLGGRPLGDVFDSLVVAAMPSELIAGGYIAAPDVYTVPVEQRPDMAGVGRVGGDFDPGGVAVAVASRAVVGSVPEHYVRHAAGLRAMFFAATVAHSRDVVAALSGAGIRAVHVDGSSPKAIRDGALADLRAHRIDVLSNVGLYIEGLDMPELKCALLGRPTESLTVMLQSVGRVLRPWNGVTPVVLDHAGNVLRHGLPTMDRVYELKKRPARPHDPDAEDSFGCKTCPACYRIVETCTSVCPGCGRAFSAESCGRKVKTLAGELVFVDPGAFNERRRFWEHAWSHAYREGLGAWLPERMYRERFGEHPTFDPPHRPDATPEEKAEFLRRMSGRAHREGRGRGWVEERYANRFGEEARRNG